MPSLAEVLAYRTRMFKASMAIVSKKGADYNRKQQANGNTLFNLEVCALLGIVPNVTTGLLVRISDKIMRLVSLASNPKEQPEVKTESVRDTIMDLHNYLDYLGILYEEVRHSA